MKLSELPQALRESVLRQSEQQVTKSFAESCEQKDRLFYQSFDITKSKEGQAYWVFIMKNGYPNEELNLTN